MNKWFIRSYWFLTGLGLFLVASGLLLAVKPLNASTQPIPVTNNQNIALPDWSQITFKSLPGISKSGSFSLPEDLISQLGYNPSRQWFAGQSPDEYMMLGDFQDALALQEFNLADIAQLVGLDLSNISLANFPLIGEQTINNLVEAIPDLLNLSVSEVAPIKDLLQGNINLNQTIGELLNQQPQLGDLSLDSLDLQQYGIGEIPGLELANLDKFKNWQGQFISEIPGLANVPFANFPISPLSQGSLFGLVDIAFGTTEQYANRSVSGSNKEGFNVTCNNGSCAHIELAGNPVINGLQWVSGQYQEVQGGEGVLSAVNNGFEPTGRHPFSKAFKVVIWDINEENASADTSLFFRVCVKTTVVDLGCTPYVIGPIPFIGYKEGDGIFLGE